MDITRRKLSAIGASVVVLPISGCQRIIGQDSSGINILVRNYTDESQRIKMELLDTDKNQYENAKVYEKEFEIPIADEGQSAAIERQRNVVPQQQLLVRTLLRKGDGSWNHFHYFPQERESPNVDVSIYSREEDDKYYVQSG